MIDQDGAGIFVIADIDLPDGRKAPGPEEIRSLARDGKFEIDVPAASAALLVVGCGDLTPVSDAAKQ